MNGVSTRPESLFAKWGNIKMSKKFNNCYRIESSRLQCWDYGWNALYFITICADQMRSYFGQINNGIMGLSEIGCLAQEYWHKIPHHFEYTVLHAFIVMPNHVHGIIQIQKSEDGRDHSGRDAVGRDAISRDAISRDAINGVSTIGTDSHIGTPPNRGGFAGEKNPMLFDNLSRIIRWYKGCVTYYVRKIDSTFTWQARFYDHIIRNEKSYDNITDYIYDNPRRWKEDRYFKHP